MAYSDPLTTFIFNKRRVSGMETLFVAPHPKAATERPSCGLTCDGWALVWT